MLFFSRRHLTGTHARYCGGHRFLAAFPAFPTVGVIVALEVFSISTLSLSMSLKQPMYVNSRSEMTMNLT